MSGGGGDNRVQETPEQVAAAKVAKEQFETYQDVFVDVENWYQNQVMNMNTADSYLRAAGIGNVEAQMAINQGMQGISGVDVNSPRFDGVSRAVATQGGSMSGRNASRAIVGQQNNYMANMGNVASIGLGQGSKAQAGMNVLAKNAEAMARQDAADQFDERMEKLGLIGTVAGVGGSVYANSMKPARQELVYPSVQQSSYGLNYSPTGTQPTTTNWDLYKS